MLHKVKVGPKSRESHNDMAKIGAGDPMNLIGIMPAKEGKVKSKIKIEEDKYSVVLRFEF